MGFNFYVPTNILFGVGELANLHRQKLPGKKALIVISDGKSAKENGYLERLEKELRIAGAEFVLFDRVGANPLKSAVMAGAKAARDGKCDFIVALGGGSVMDAAKAIAAMAVNEGDLWDYMNGGTGKGQELKDMPLPLITITTTAGTGSEADAWGVITNEETHEKMGFHGDYPVLSVVDAGLMVSVPPKFTAFQGFDALFHSVECYISRAANLMSDMFALTAIENIARYLPEAVKNGMNIEARERVAFANTLSGIVMTLSSCTSEHSMEHAMSAYHQELPHGAGLIMISKAYFTHFINKHVCDERFIKMAEAMGLKNAKEPMDFIKALEMLQKDCDVDGLKMSDYGIKPEETDVLAKNARETMGALFDFDPVLMSHQECVAIYDASYQ